MHKKVKYEGQYYSVKIFTALKIYWFKFVLLCFRICHLFKRVIGQVFDTRNTILIAAVIIYFFGTMFLNIKEDLSLCGVLQNTIDESIDVILFTLFVPVLTECIIQESDRKRKLNKRYWAWYSVGVQLDNEIKEILGPGTYLSLSTYNNDYDLQKLIDGKILDMYVLRNKLRIIQAKVNIIMKNSLDYSMEDEDVNLLQERCIKIESNIEDIKSYSIDGDIIAIKEDLTEIISELRSLDLLLGDIWIRDTMYNCKIIHLIENDDANIKQQRCYQRYIR